MKHHLIIIVFVLVSCVVSRFDSLLRQKVIVRHHKMHTIKLAHTGLTFQARLLESLNDDSKEFQTMQLGLPSEQQYLDLIAEMSDMTVEQRREHVDKTAIVNVPYKNYYNAQYFGNVTVGSRQQQMSVMFDTGSAYMFLQMCQQQSWFASDSCTGCKKAGIKDDYTCKGSSSCKDQGGEVKLQYGSGKAKSHSVTDTIGIGQMHVNNQYLLVLETLSQLRSFFGDGLLGMGFASLAKGQKTLIDNLYEQKQISERTFSIYLTDMQAEQKKHSALVIGGYDPAYISVQEPKWTYCPIVSSYYWGISVEAFSLVHGTTKYSMVKQNPTAEQTKIQSAFAIIDSGTSILTLDKQDFAAFHLFIKKFKTGCSIDPKYGLIVCTQQDISEYPDIQINMCGNVFSLQPDDFLMCQGGKCYILIEELDFPITILGDLFIRKYYTLYKQDVQFMIYVYKEPRQIGFVRAAK